MTGKVDPLFIYDERVQYTQRNMLQAGCLQNCANCGHADHDKNICRKFNATPPMKVAAEGCRNWVYNIPF